MARVERRRPENIAGDFYVDDTCIDCDTCRWLAPATFDRVGDQSRVHRQPRDDAELSAALAAVVACPTVSIGATEQHDLAEAVASFPSVIEGPVFYCGFHHEASFGATSYFLQHPDGNVLIDTPRFNGPLVRRLEQLGGIATMFLTHKDDAADHARFAAHFGAQRILHADDMGPDTRDVERPLQGVDPVPLADDLTVIPVPGHTRGSACLLWRDVLFSGDHLWHSATLGHLATTRTYCQYDWQRQRESVELLLDYAFRWVLPGHGRRLCLPPDRMAEQVRRCAHWMTTIP